MSIDTLKKSAPHLIISIVIFLGFIGALTVGIFHKSYADNPISVSSLQIVNSTTGVVLQTITSSPAQINLAQLGTSYDFKAIPASSQVSKIKATAEGQTVTYASPFTICGKSVNSPCPFQAGQSVTLTLQAFTATGTAGTAQPYAITVVNQPPASITSFSASPTTITSGATTTLSWVTANATSVSISPTVGTIAASGSKSVSPTQTTTYTLTAFGGGATSTKSVTVTVNPAAVAPTSLKYQQNPAVYTVGTAVSNAASVTGTVTSYSVTPALPAGLMLNTTSGLISGTPTLATAQTPYTITAKNSAGSTSASLVITVNAAPLPPTITTFSASPLTITSGATTTLSWVTANATSVSISNGTLSSSAPASGSEVVTLTQNTTFTITAVGNGTTVTKSVTITVNPSVVVAAPSNLTYQVNPAVYTTGTAVSNAASVTGSVTSYSITPALPAGLTLSTSTGLISGTPTLASAQATYVISAQNSAGSATASVVISVVQSALPASISSFSASPASVAAGSASTLSWTTTNAVSASLNNGIGAVGTSSSISVSPAQTTTYVLTVYGGGATTTAQTTVSVMPVVLAPTNLLYQQNPAVYTVGTAVSNTASVTGSVTSYSVTPALPAGLILNSATGLISGTPTLASAQAPYTVTAQNAGGTATASLLITVQTQPTTLQAGQTYIIPFQNANSMATGPFQVEVRLPQNWVPTQTYPLLVWMGGDGDTMDQTMQEASGIVGTSSVVIAAFPLVGVPNTMPGVDPAVILDNSYPEIQPAFQQFLQATYALVPNLNQTNNAIGGFSDGAHTVGVLWDEEDGNLSNHFNRLIFGDGGGALWLDTANLSSVLAYGHGFHVLGLWSTTDGTALTTLVEPFYAAATSSGIDATLTPMNHPHEWLSSDGVISGNWLSSQWGITLNP